MESVVIWMGLLTMQFLKTLKYRYWYHSQKYSISKSPDVLSACLKVRNHSFLTLEIVIWQNKITFYLFLIYSFIIMDTIITATKLVCQIHLHDNWEFADENHVISFSKINSDAGCFWDVSPNSPFWRQRWNVLTTTPPISCDGWHWI